MKRRTAVWRIGGAAAFGLTGPLRAAAQSAAKMPRIGVLRWGAPGDDAIARLAEALAAIGLRENQTIAIEWRYASTRELAQRHAAELAAMNLDLLVGSATPAVVALRDATKTRPIVIYGAADPVGTGLVTTLSRPGGNLTGVSTNLPGTVPKQLQLLGEVVNGLQRVAFLGSTNDPATKLFVEQAQAAVRTLGMALQVVLIGQPKEFEAALESMVRERAQAVIVQPLFVISQAELLTPMLTWRKLPSVSAVRPFPLAGGLMSYGFSRTEMARRTASFVDRVLKGASPANLPVEEPTSYELVINLTTAKALGLSIAQSLRLRADEVIG